MSASVVSAISGTRVPDQLGPSIPVNGTQGVNYMHEARPEFEKT
jgi:hypothetical protein